VESIIRNRIILPGKNAQKKYQWKNGEMQECWYAELNI
jgi:hypothetical protein